MAQDSNYTPLSAKETISSPVPQMKLPAEDQCINSLSSTMLRDSKGASGLCILRPPKPKEDIANSDMCTYPSSTMEDKTLDSEILMIIINNIFHYSNFETVKKLQIGLQVSGDNVAENTLDLPENIRDIIRQIKFDVNPDVDVPETAFQILYVVMDYTWEAKMVLILAALVMRYGDFCLSLLLQTSEFLVAKYLYKLKERPPHQTREVLSSNLTPLSNLVKKLLEICTIMLQIMKDNDQLVLADMEQKVTKVLHNIVYQVIKVGVACSSYMELVVKDIEYIMSDVEMKQLDYLLKELLDSHKYLTDLKNIIDHEAAQNFTPTQYRDIRNFFNKLFIEDKALNRESMIQIGFEELNGYTTAFLVSDINIRIENFSILVETHDKISKDKKFRIVWIPVVDQTVEWTDAKEKSFNEVANSMPWCCCHPLMLTKSFSTHIVESWQYKKEPSLVVLNEQAEVIAKNALLVMETWGDKAYPFSSDVVTTISKSWTIKKMVEDWEIDQINWENDIVCIYGGCDLELIRSFTKCVKSVKHNKIKAIYVGTNGPKEDLQNIVSSLEEFDVKCLPMSLLSSFWKRLAIILEKRLGNQNALDQDPGIEQLTTLLGYNKKELWSTMMYKGSTEFIKSTGAQLLQSFEGSTEFENTNELWECLIQRTKPENHTTLNINASACERIRNLFESEHEDVSVVLAKVFIKETGIFEGQTGLEHFKGKSVGFLVTHMEAKSEEVTALVEKYKQIHQGPDLKIIWIPIVDDEGQKPLTEKALSMRWYYCHPSMLTKDFSTYLRQECYGQTRSTLAVLNKQGKLVSTLQWDASTFPWKYRVEKEPRSDWLVYTPAKELSVLYAKRGVDWKYSNACEYDGIRDVPFDVIEIYASVEWAVFQIFKGKLAPNILYESIFLVMLTDESQGWESPVLTNRKRSMV